MAEQKLIISTTTPDGLDASKTISNINPEASNEKLAELGQKITAFTDNTYGRTDRVIKYNCDTESGGGKQTPTITLAKSTDTKANVFATTGSYLQYNFTFTYDGDGVLFIHSSSPWIYANTNFDSSTQQYSLLITANFTPTDVAGQITEDVTITFLSTETDTYKAAEATFTITV